MDLARWRWLGDRGRRGDLVRKRQWYRRGDQHLPVDWMPDADTDDHYVDVHLAHDEHFDHDALNLGVRAQREGYSGAASSARLGKRFCCRWTSFVVPAGSIYRFAAN